MKPWVEQTIVFMTNQLLEREMNLHFLLWPAGCGSCCFVINGLTDDWLEALVWESFDLPAMITASLKQGFYHHKEGGQKLNAIQLGYRHPLQWGDKTEPWLRWNLSTLDIHGDLWTHQYFGVILIYGFQTGLKIYGLCHY